MIEQSVLKKLGIESGKKLDKYTSVGAYPLAYFCNWGNCYCAECASKTDKKIVNADVHWEGSALECEECGGYIESAYGEPE